MVTMRGVEQWIFCPEWPAARSFYLCRVLHVDLLIGGVFSHPNGGVVLLGIRLVRRDSIHAEQAALKGDRDRFGAVMDAEFLEQPLHVGLDGFLGEKHRGGHVLVAAAAGNEA